MLLRAGRLLLVINFAEIAEIYRFLWAIIDVLFTVRTFFMEENNLSNYIENKIRFTFIIFRVCI